MAVKGCRRPALTHASGTHPPQLWRPSDRGESQTRTLCGIASNKAKPKIHPLQFEVYIIVFIVPLRSMIFIGIIFGGLHLYIASVSPRRAWFDIRAVHVRFMMDSVVLGQTVRVLRSSPVIIIPSELRIHISFICHRRYITMGTQNTFLFHSKHAASVGNPVNAVLRKSRCLLRAAQLVTAYTPCAKYRDSE